MDAKKLNQFKLNIDSYSLEQLRPLSMELIDFAQELLGAIEIHERVQEEMAVEIEKQAAVIKEVIAEKTAKSVRISHLEELLAVKNHEQYGSSSEKMAHKTAEQLPEDVDVSSVQETAGESSEEPVSEEPLALNVAAVPAAPAEEEKQEIASSEPKKDNRKKKYASRKLKYKDLAVLVAYGWDVDRISKEYGDDWSFIEWESHQQLEYVPAFTYLKETRIPVIAVGPESTPVRLPFEDIVIPRSDLSSSFAAALVDEKYHWHVPTNRLAERLRAQGLDITRQNLDYKLMRIIDEFLIPVADYMKETLLDTDHIQVDETPIEVLGNDKKDSNIGYFWAYVSSEVGESTPKAAVFSFDWSRSGTVPEEFLNLSAEESVEKKIHLMHDGYSGYKWLEKKYGDKVVGSCCLTHFRRNWIIALEILRDALKRGQKDQTLETTIEYKVIDQLAEIYSLDTPSKKLSKEERLKIRQEKIRPLMNKLFDQIHVENEKMQAHPEEYSDHLKKAITYSINQEKSFSYSSMILRFPLTIHSQKDAFAQ